MFASRSFSRLFNSRLLTLSSRPCFTSVWQNTKHYSTVGRNLRSTPWQQTFQYSASSVRGYRRQAFNYQQFKNTQGLFKRWSSSPNFKYQVGGITALGGGFYAVNLERVPVRAITKS